MIALTQEHPMLTIGAILLAWACAAVAVALFVGPILRDRSPPDEG